MIWRKSSHSNSSTECLEVAEAIPGLIRIRDSKRSGDPTLIITANTATWTAFLSSLRADNPLP
ncbi:DUF397 domain-containing protein [Streptomyces sp. I05A-00742]|uniref:DUF397 domain-containing protein n=1 Tax=Streptomyces sp. I05A-00742 TaxID=2732853 RepID=UPI001487854E|nr:DUF397 domain-containing protein [Streptomyces sp. I05A-00742]